MSAKVGTRLWSCMAELMAWLHSLRSGSGSVSLECRFWCWCRGWNGWKGLDVRVQKNDKKLGAKPERLVERRVGSRGFECGVDGHVLRDHTWHKQNCAEDAEADVVARQGRGAENQVTESHGGDGQDGDATDADVNQDGHVHERVKRGTVVDPGCGVRSTCSPEQGEAP